eukprot:scaffold5850_cov73-Skeletonema_dohrnii-CCMP3373.AAC.2
MELDTCRPVPDHLVDLFSNSCSVSMMKIRRIYTKSVSSSTDPETRLEHLLPRDEYTQTFTSFQLWTDPETRLELETTRTHHVASFKHGQNFEKYRLDMGSRESRRVHQGRRA